MAQFRGTIRGVRGGGASRLGTKSSGLVVTANGWDTGARVELLHRAGRDVVIVYRTGGSNDPEGRIVAQWTDDDAREHGPSAPESFYRPGPGVAYAATEAEPGVCGHRGCTLRPGHIPGHTDR